MWRYLSGRYDLNSHHQQLRLHTMTINRTRLAYVLAPLFPSAYLLLFSPVFGPMDGGWRFVVLIFSLPFSYLACLAFGVPGIALLKRVRRCDVVTITIMGAILGMMVFYVFGFYFAWLLGSSTDVIPTLSELGFGAQLGVLVAFPFSLIAGYPFLSEFR